MAVSETPFDTLRGAANRFVLVLPSSEFEQVRPSLEHVELARGQTIYREDGPVDYLYFVNRGLISLIKTMRDGRTVEIGAIGVEGVAGWNAALGMQGALFDAVVQVPGEALRVESRRLRRQIEALPMLRTLFWRYADFAVKELAQHAACNRLHSLEERCCRWLLIAHDSARSDAFPMTHEFLSMMLGVQRTAVSIAANVLQKAEFIHYTRGRVTVTNRSGLEAMACECYQAVRDRLEHVYAVPDLLGADLEPRRR